MGEATFQFDGEPKEITQLSASYRELLVSAGCTNHSVGVFAKTEDGLRLSIRVSEWEPLRGGMTSKIGTRLCDGLAIHTGVSVHTAYPQNPAVDEYHGYRPAEQSLVTIDEVTVDTAAGEIVVAGHFDDLPQVALSGAEPPPPYPAEVSISATFNVRVELYREDGTDEPLSLDPNYVEGE